MITDGDLTLAESGAIMDYILQKYGRGRLAVAPDRRNYPDYLFWLHYANASLLPIVIGIMSRQAAGSSGQPTLEQGFASRAQNAFAMIEGRLGECAYFAGDEFTAADIMMLLPLATIRKLLAPEASAQVNVHAYVQRIKARPAFQCAIHKADPESPRQID